MLAISNCKVIFVRNQQHCCFNLKAFTPYTKLPRFIILILLALLVVFQIAGEKIPVNEGAIGDGIFFRQVAIEFVDVIDADSYNYWQLQHILPFAIVHVVYVIFGLDLEPAPLLSGMLILNFILLWLGIYWFTQLSKKMRLSVNMDLFAFVLLFFNFLILKEAWYNPFSSDMFAFALGIGMANYFLRYEKTKLLLLTLVGVFVSPILLPIGGFLLLLPGDKLEMFGGPRPKSVAPVAVTALVIFVLTVLGLITNRFTNLQASLLYISCILAVGCVVFFMLYKNPVNWSKSFMQFRKKIKPEKLTALLILFASAAVILFLLSGTNANIEFSMLATNFWLELLRYPFDFITGHLAYFGVLFVLILLFFNRFLKEMAKLGMGCTLVILLFLILFFYPDSSILIPFTPLLVVIVIKAIRRFELQTKDLIVVGLINLLLSLFYLPLNVPRMVEGLESKAYVLFPAQRYFLHYGNHQNVYVYAVGLLLAIGLMVLFYVGKKRYIREELL